MLLGVMDYFVLMAKAKIEKKKTFAGKHKHLIHHKMYHSLFPFSAYSVLLSWYLFLLIIQIFFKTKIVISESTSGMYSLENEQSSTVTFSAEIIMKFQPALHKNFQKSFVSLRGYLVVHILFTKFYPAVMCIL